MGISNSDIMNTLGRIEGKVDEMAKRQNGMALRISTHITDEDAHGAGTRNRLLSKIGAVILGILAFVGGAMGIYSKASAK